MASAVRSDGNDCASRRPPHCAPVVCSHPTKPPHEIAARFRGDPGSLHDFAGTPAFGGRLMTTLWDTTGTAVVKALAAERRGGGAGTRGNAVTLVVVVGEKDGSE